MADSDGSSGLGMEKHLRWQWYVMGVFTGLFLAGLIMTIVAWIAGY